MVDTVDTPQIAYPRTFTCHPQQNWILGRSGFNFVRCILLIANQEEYERFQVALALVHPLYRSRVKEVTPELLQVMLTGAAALPTASKGTDSETAKAAMHQMRGEIAATQLKAKEEEAARILADPKGPTVPVTVADLQGKESPAAPVTPVIPVTAESMLA